MVAVQTIHLMSEETLIAHTASSFRGGGLLQFQGLSFSDETLYDDLNLDNEAEVQFGMIGDKDLQSDGLSNLRWVNLAAST
ncbi:hypothetical protein AtubIFM56815_005657 [Aspergillus tubingensis]|uniref:Uncharacterized protein n=1 Tax=Aspergillus tubingensis TaxID=5068 RepID=A0A9W6ERN7_ASPTU|nr:hypothetical protein AtubIFM56815_005657 [Aspergillus tubingensis]